MIGNTPRSTTVAAALSLLFAAGPAMADCFDFKPDSFSNLETITKVEVAGSETFQGELAGIARHQVWIGKTGYLAAYAAAGARPTVVVTLPGGENPLVEGWDYEPKEPLPDYKYSQLTMAGTKAHRNGDGWVDVVVYARGDGPYQLWVHKVEPIVRPADDHCDASYVAFQGGDQCEICASTPAPPVNADCGCGAGECCAEGMLGMPECRPGPADATGFCTSP